MVIADGGHSRPYLTNEVWVLCLENYDSDIFYKDIISWLTENIGPIQQRGWKFSPYASSFSEEKLVQILDYDQAWNFMEWLEEYEEDRSLHSN